MGAIPEINNQTSPEIKDFWGVDKPATIKVLEEKHDRKVLEFEDNGIFYIIRRYPYLYIDYQIVNIYKSRNIIEKYNIGFNEISNRWVEATNLIDNWENKLKPNK